MSSVELAAALYPRFSAEEFARRYEAARVLMAREGIDALVVYGNSAFYRHQVPVQFFVTQ